MSSPKFLTFYILKTNILKVFFSLITIILNVKIQIIQMEILQYSLWEECSKNVTSNMPFDNKNVGFHIGLFYLFHPFMINF